MTPERMKELRALWAGARLLLDDDTSWPAPHATDHDCAIAYRVLIEHPWGANVSADKVRMLRRAHRERKCR